MFPANFYSPVFGATGEKTDRYSWMEGTPADTKRRKQQPLEVYLRVRPLLKDEKDQGQTSCFQLSDSSQTQVTIISPEVPFLVNSCTSWMLTFVLQSLPNHTLIRKTKRRLDSNLLVFSNQKMD